MFGVVAAIVLSVPSQATMADQLAAEFERAEVIKKIADQTDQIVIGNFFITPANIKSGHAELIKEALRKAFHKNGVTEGPSKYELRGKVFLQTKNVAAAIAKVTFEVVNTDNDERVGDEMKFSTTTAGIVATLLGRNITIDPNETPRDRAKQVLSVAKTVVEDAQDPKPTRMVSKDIITEGDYSVRFLVKGIGDKDFHPIGMSYNPAGKETSIKLAKNDVFKIEITNNDIRKSDVGYATDALVETIIDGVNIFQTAEDPDFRNRRYVVRSGKTMVVPGWFKTTKYSTEFKVADYPQSLRARLGLPQNAPKASTISLVFRQAWDPDKAPKTQGGLGIAEGGQVQTNSEEVPMKAGPESAIISIRYSSK